MMKHVLALCALLWAGLTPPAYAGQELDSFKADVANYLTAQKANPDKIIQYADKDGPLAKAALNPKRIQRLVSEAFDEGPSSSETFKASLENFKLVAVNYQGAFAKLPGQYDAEYLDSYEVMYQLTVSSFRQLQRLKLSDIKDESARSVAEAAAKMAAAIPDLLLKSLEKQIADGQFGKAFVPVAQARVAALRAQLGAQQAAKP